MIVYADVLVAVNLIVDYFLLLATDKILRLRTKSVRLVLSALAGGFSSMYIFLPKASPVAEFSYKIACCIIMSLIAFAGGAKRIFKASAVLFVITCGYAGGMMAIWRIFKPNGMVINNSVVYFNISPLVLVAVSVLSYFVFLFLFRFLKATVKTAGECSVTVSVPEGTTQLRAILDSGNSLEDVFGKSEIIIADRTAVEALFGVVQPKQNPELQTRYRLIPCNTVSGSDVLEGYRCDSAVIKTESRSVTIEKPILAISKTPLRDGYNAIVNPEILN
ncbi:MAG: sigma-E processing peptidase SpoIIGA [Clostridia bacterium]|nr:sigma-E processing peptidase SpoIIGA [Clostridia bacterium]